MTVSRAGSVFFFQAEDGIRDSSVTGVQTCALPIYRKALYRGVENTTRNHCFFIFYPSVERFAMRREAAGRGLFPSKPQDLRGEEDSKGGYYPNRSRWPFEQVPSFEHRFLSSVPRRLCYSNKDAARMNILQFFQQFRNAGRNRSRPKAQKKAVERQPQAAQE